MAETEEAKEVKDFILIVAKDGLEKDPSLRRLSKEVSLKFFLSLPPRNVFCDLTLFAV
jgi:hypothetical protein